MDLKQLINDHLKSARVMQVATSANNQPWVCNVHYYSDDDLNLYWISKPDRRHSEELAQNKKASITIMVHEDIQSEKYIIGVSAEGVAEVLSDEEAKKIGDQYIKKLEKDPNLLKDILEGRNPHKFYKFTPKNFVIFDTKNFPDQPRQEYKIT